MRITPTRIMITLILTIALTGCGVSKETRRSAVNDDTLRSNFGAVLVSTSAPETCLLGTKSYLALRADDNSSNLPGFTIEINNHWAKSDFPNRVGFIDAITLEPGKYWLSLEAHGNWRLRNPIRLPFYVNKGEITYLGNVNFVGCSTFDLQITDKWTDVKPSFQNRFPNLNLGSVNLRLLRIEK